MSFPWLIRGLVAATFGASKDFKRTSAVLEFLKTKVTSYSKQLNWQLLNTFLMCKKLK